jgi:hypothetical protein
MRAFIFYLLNYILVRADLLYIVILIANILVLVLIKSAALDIATTHYRDVY